MTHFSTITKSWKSFVTHKKLIPLAVIVDIIFIYALTRLHYEVFNRASEYALRLTDMMSEQVQKMADAGTPELSVLNSQAFTSAYHELLKYIGLFLAYALLIWLVCRGLVWFIAHHNAEKKVNIGIFSLKFLGMTLFWFTAFIFITFAALNLIDYSMTGLFPVIGMRMANIIAGLMYWVLAYFMFISYATIPHNVFKQTFRLGIREWKELLPAHIIGTLILIAAVVVPTFLVKINVWLPLAFVALIALPAVAWARTLWVIAVHKVIHNE